MIKINKSKFLYNNLLFVISILIYVSFKLLLGEANAFVGITIVQAAFLLLNYDLTGSLKSQFLKFILINLYIGIFTYLASINVYYGLLINFLALFILAYALTYDLKNSISYPFLFGYIFLSIHSVELKLLPIRLIALVIGSFIIVLLQFIFNRNKSRKIIRDNLDELSYDINKKIENIFLNKNEKIALSVLKKNIDLIIKTIYDKRDNYFHLNYKDRIILNMALYFERLKFDLDELIHPKNDLVYLRFLEDLSNIIIYIPSSLDSNSNMANLEKMLYSIIDKYKALDDTNYSLYEMLQNLKTLKFSICTKNQFVASKNISIPNKFQFDNVFNFNFFTVKSVRFSYALRVSFLISISFFAVSFLGSSEGKWLPLTIFPLIQPYSELSSRKIPVKFKGTLLGIVIFAMLTYIPYINPYLIFVYLAFYYFYIILSESILKTALLTVTVLGLVSIAELSPKTAELERLLFISLGILIGYLGTKLILPFTLNDSLRKFTKNHYMLTKDIIHDGFKYKLNNILITDLNDKLFISKLIENKILTNNAILDSTVIKKFIYNQRILNNDLYFLMFSLNKHNASNSILLNLKENLYLSYSRHSVDYYREEDLILDIKNIEKIAMTKTLTNIELLIFVNTYKIIRRLEISNNLLLAIISILDNKT